MKRALKNKHEYFEKEKIELIRKQFNFSQARHIEMLLWDFEILSQLLEYNPNFILRGGAAAQVYLPENIQRASRDIDIATTLSLEEIEKALNNITQKFSQYVESKEHFTWERKNSKNEKTKIEDLCVYMIIVPTKIDFAPYKKGFSYLKLDIICYKELPFKVKKISNPKILGLDFLPLSLLSEGSLIADKLLTLGDDTTGILAINKENFDGFFKQLYDLTKLVDNFILEKGVLEDFFFTLEKLTPTEIGYRKLDISILDVLEDIIKSLDKKMDFDLENNEYSIELRDKLESFRANYLNKDEWVSPNIWASRLGKLKFITSLAKEKFLGKKDISQIKNEFEILFDIEKKLNNLKGEELKLAREKLLKYYPPKTKNYKMLKNSTLLKVFYCIINQENLERISNDFKGL